MTYQPKRKFRLIDTMKTIYKTVLSLLLLCLFGAGTGPLFAQGTIDFTNMKPFKQIITDPDGNRVMDGWAQLYAGTTADNLSAVGSPVAFEDNAKRYGYFKGGPVNVGFLGAGFFQVRAWQGADTLDRAYVRGESNVFVLTPGNSLANPPELPRSLAGLKSFSLIRYNDLLPKFGILLWRFATGGGVESSPAIGTDGTVYVGSEDNKFYALDGKSGAKKWEFVTKGWVRSSPAIGDDGTVYIGSFDNKVYALNSKNGFKKWEFCNKR